MADQRKKARITGERQDLESNGVFQDYQLTWNQSLEPDAHRAPPSLSSLLRKLDEQV
jgi:DNA/RNA-binding domain of Phe-tRNA-synthetase-like protein